MQQKISLNTALLIAILCLLLTRESSHVHSSPIQVTPAIAETIATPAVKPESTLAATVTPASLESGIISITLIIAEPPSDPVAYYKAKERHLRSALMKKR